LFVRCSKKDPLNSLAITLEMLSFLLHDESLVVVKRVIQAGAVVFNLGIQFIAGLPVDKIQDQKAWFDQLMNLKVLPHCHWVAMMSCVNAGDVQRG
jgi:hypothetical protein